MAQKNKEEKGKCEICKKKADLFEVEREQYNKEAHEKSRISMLVCKECHPEGYKIDSAKRKSKILYVKPKENPQTGGFNTGGFS